jgi:hypothetical protein
MPAPRSSACSPWIDQDDVAATVNCQRAVAKATIEATKVGGYTISSEQITAIFAESAAAATEMLYRLSGRQFTGKCGPVRIRPVARPVQMDSQFAIGRQWSYGGYGSTSAMAMGLPAIARHFGPEFPYEILLHDYPVRSIIEVKIDGIIIPPDEYELREYQRLVRLRTSASETPTARFGWPTSQYVDLPDTEEGTFSVLYEYGTDPGIGGKTACTILAESMALPRLGDTTTYPERTTSVTRQGVTVQVASVEDVVKSGQTGIYAVDRWIMSVNPTKARRQAVVFSPDRAPNRRTATPNN